MKPDITSTEDVKKLLDAFYAKVLVDDTIGYIFTDIAKINLAKHMPHLYAFWDTVLFGTANYKGNPILKHIELDKKEPLTDVHFARWIKLFFETIDDLFEGKKTDFAKEKAKAMEFLMKMKIEDSRKHGFIH
jgi:hemoglobin